ncbi:Large subunit GTPase 1 [Blattella germanica]|nr:Large subunit GTPase 1 [Blattella germanica]
MGKKNKSNNNLGRALIKDRFGSSNSRRSKDPSLLHTAEVDDGYDWGRLNLQSVTEESSFQEFLSTAELAGTEFQAEKLNVTFVSPSTAPGILSGEDLEKTKETQDKHRELLGIPRRPPWDANTTAEQLQSAEREDFLEWRRRLARLQEVEGVLLTPYEKNLEFWRQLWRVVERSDIVVQIVDARNPLLFRCEDLEKYVKEVSSHKHNLILINKADFLTPSQRLSWAEYFNTHNVKVAFYSATLASEEDEDDDSDSDDSNENTIHDNESRSTEKTDDSNGNRVVDYENVVPQPGNSKESSNDIGEKEQGIIKSDLNEKDKIEDFPSGSGDGQRSNESEKVSTSDSKNCVTKVLDEIKECSISPVSNSNDLLSREELITLFKTYHTGEKVTPGLTTVGLVGYPNTLYLDKDLLLCDCPGLVMPSFVFTKAEMVVNGILPIDQMRDHVPPVTLVATLIPRSELESVYGIMLPPPQEGKDPSSPPTAEELLNAYGSRYILKDFVKGKLLYCLSPPGFDQSQYHTFPERGKPRVGNVQKSRSVTEELDVQFFRKATVGVHVKGAGDSKNVNSNSKPWKDHKNKRNKREKLRRVYAHLDQ